MDATEARECRHVVYNGGRGCNCELAQLHAAIEAVGRVRARFWGHQPGCACRCCVAVGAELAALREKLKALGEEPSP